MRKSLFYWFSALIVFASSGWDLKSSASVAVPKSPEQGNGRAAASPCKTGLYEADGGGLGKAGLAGWKLSKLCPQRVCARTRARDGLFRACRFQCESSQSSWFYARARAGARRGRERE